MKLVVEPNHLLLSGEKDILQWIYSKYSFRDKQVEYQLNKLRKRNEFWRLRGLWRNKYDSFDEFVEGAAQEEQVLEEKLDVYCCQYIGTCFLPPVYLRIPIGLYESVLGELMASNLFFQITDNRDFNLLRKNLKGYCHPLRPPQAIGIQELLKAPLGMLRMATGVGKTTVGQEVIRHYGLQSLFLVPSRPILNQTVERFRAAFGSRYVGKVGDGKKKHSYITVATYQSVFSGDPEDFLDYQLVIADECFPYWQRVLTEEGPIAIGKLFWRWIRNKPMPKAVTFLDGKMILKNIKRAFITKADRPMIKVTLGRNEIVCTPDHLFKTHHGWVEAKDLSGSDLVFGNVDKKRRNDVFCPVLNDDQMAIVIGSFLGDGHLQKTRSDVNLRYRLRVIHGADQKNYCQWKADMFGVKTSLVEKNGYAQKPAYRFSSLAFDLPFSLPSKKGDCPDELISLIDERALAIWFMDDGSIDHKKRQARIHTNSFSEETCHKLICKLGELGIDSHLGFSRHYPTIYIGVYGYETLMSAIGKFVHSSMSYKSRPSESSPYCWDGQFKEFGTCPVTRVVPYTAKSWTKSSGMGLFDLEIEDTHNYVVTSATSESGAIVHNCHHVPADTFYEVIENRLQNAIYRYGLTADEERSDGGTILVEAAVGPVVYSYEAPEAIRDGYLAKPTFVFYEIGKTYGTYTKWKTDRHGNRIDLGPAQSEAYTGEEAHPAYKNWILGNDLLNARISEIAAGFANSGSSVLILIDEKEHGDKLLQYLKPHGAELVIGGAKGNDEILARFNARELKIVIGTSTIGEGADTVPVDVLVNLMGGTKTKQVNGRALRNDPDPETGLPRKPTTLIIDFDVPNCPVLNRHAKLREEVDATCGKVYRLPLFTD